MYMYDVRGLLITWWKSTEISLLKSDTKMLNTGTNTCKVEKERVRKNARYRGRKGG